MTWSYYCQCFCAMIILYEINLKLQHICFTLILINVYLDILHLKDSSYKNGTMNHQNAWITLLVISSSHSACGQKVSTTGHVITEQQSDASQHGSACQYNKSYNKL